jgi:Tfp pilus assembly protein PilF
LNLLDNLIVFHKEDPADPFNIYALAIEYLKHDKLKSKLFFEDLLVNHPKYIATYYHAAALFADFGEIELAKKTYTEGIKMAESQNKQNALRELKGAYQMLLDEEHD